MRLLWLWCVLFLLSSCSASRRWSKSLMALEQKCTRAIEAKDSTIISAIYADDFIGVTDGMEYDKRMLMKFFQSNTLDLRFVNNDQHIRFLDNRTAVMTGQLTAKDKDDKIVGGARYAHVYVYRNSKWQIAYAHGTIIPLALESESFSTTSN